MDLEIITACRWLPVHVQLALSISLLTAITAFTLLLIDIARLLGGSKINSRNRFRARAILLVLAAGALISVSYYHGVTVRAEVSSYEAASGRSSAILQRATAIEARRDLFLPVATVTLVLLSLLLAQRNDRAERG